jgi:ComF family protein
MKKLFAFFECFWEDLLSIFYPRLCLGCDAPLVRVEKYICLHCQADLPETGFHKMPDNNSFTERFIGRTPIKAAAACYWFTRRSRVQQIIHHIKYYNKPEVATEIGRMYGYTLSRAPPFAEADCLIPVPMHPKKQHLRGYNQAEVFAQGLSESMQIPLITNNLYKTKMTESQTKMSRQKRLENTEGVFALRYPMGLCGKKIILADDVMTSGATLEACCQAIWDELPDAEIQLVTIAFAASS